MADERVKTLLARSSKLFGRRSSLLSLWEDIAEEFYPERADFLNRRHLGDEFADHLMTGAPVLVRRELGNSLGAMLRPRQKQWFHIKVKGVEESGIRARRWLEWASDIMRREMYDKRTLFTRATKEGDMDFATFGQCVIQLEPNRDLDGYLYRCWHLRDCAWMENSEGKVAELHRQWRPSARELVETYGIENVHQMVAESYRDPERRENEFECIHIMMETRHYTGDKEFQRFPFVSIMLDKSNEHVMEEVGLNRFEYIIPRWQTVSGSQYAYSPATVVGLPDARLIQSMTRTLLEAGERYTSPPMIAVQEAIRSDVQLFAGGITWADAKYDEKLGEVLRPLTQDKAGYPIGADSHDRLTAQMREAFYIDKLTLPVLDGTERTAFEVAQLIEQYIRQAMPIFEPMENDYNGAVCEDTFTVMMEMNRFGAIENIPDELRAQELEFRFESPLHDAIEKQKGQKFMEAKSFLREAFELDPNVAVDMDVRTALRDVLEGVGAPAKWIRPRREADQAIEQIQQQQELEETARQVAGAAEVGKMVGEADQALSQ